jgi:hypothetical protein
MDVRKLGKALLFPPAWIPAVLTPLSAVLLVYAMVFVGTESVIAYVSYVLAAYTLTVVCFRIPRLIRFVKTFKSENRYAVRWLEDTHLRVKVSLYGSLLWNLVYGLFQLWLGLVHRTFWFGSLGAYYICLAIMRYFLARHTGKYAPGERMREELKKYRACGWVFLIMNLALSLIVFFMLYWNRTFHHHMITAIAMAAYTFTSFTAAIVSVIKYRQYQSPVYSASKAISFAAACVSMLTLTSTMLTAFDDGTLDGFSRNMMLGSLGITVVAVVLTMAVYMIVKGTRQLKQHRNEV